MFEWLKPKVKVEYRVVEVNTLERPRSDKSDKELMESVLTLQSHPGFVYLIQRLSAFNAALRSKLIGERHDDIKVVNFLQAGIYWSDWLKSELASATRRASTKPSDAYAEELEAFTAIDNMLERVGMDQTPT